MNSLKCKNCGLSNFPSDFECRRCGFSLLSAPKSKKEKTQTYAGAVRDSKSLSDHNKHIQETEKMMQQISNGK